MINTNDLLQFLQLLPVAQWCAQRIQVIPECRKCYTVSVVVVVVILLPSINKTIHTRNINPE